MRIFALEVGPAFRNQGVGTALIGAVEGEMRCRGLQFIHLEVAFEIVDAIRLYERLGYQRQGDPVIYRWRRLSDGGSSVQMEEVS